MSGPAFPAVAHRPCPGCQRPVPVHVPACSCGTWLHRRPEPTEPHPGWLVGTIACGLAWLAEFCLLWISLPLGLWLVSMPILLPCMLVTGLLLYLCGVQLGRRR